MATEKNASKFWSSAALEPKRQFRFVLQLSAIESYVITKVNRPSFEIGESEHNYINHKFYYPGRVTWNDVSFSLVDAIAPDTTGILMKMLVASGYRFPTSKTATRTISKAEAVSAVGTCAIKMYGHLGSKAAGDKGDLIETWSLHNPWVRSVTMGDLDYSTDEILSMDVTLKYDWATLDLGKDADQRIATPNHSSATMKDGVKHDNLKG